MRTLERRRRRLDGGGGKRDRRTKNVRGGKRMNAKHVDLSRKQGGEHSQSKNERR